MEHRIILGGAQYLPFARKEVVSMRATGLEYASRAYEINGVSISIKIAGQESYIRLKGTPYRYQFFVSDNPLQIEVVGFIHYIGTAVAVKDEAVKSPGLLPGVAITGTSAGAAPPVGKAVSVDKLISKFPYKNAFQVQAITEYAYYANAKAGGLVVNSWSCGSQVENIATYGGNRHNELLKMSIDILYDLPTTRNGKWFTPDADWYKRGAMRSVSPPEGVTEYGDRSFFLLTDTSNILHVFPVGSAGELAEYEATLKTIYGAQAIKTNVPESQVRRVQIPLPAWCRSHLSASRDVPQTGVWLEKLLLTAPQYRWAFNSTATKMCSVVYETLTTPTIAGPVLTGTPFTFTEAYSAQTHPIQEALAGVVEFSVAITLTGPNPEDFIVTMEQVNELRPTVTGDYIFGADYAWAHSGMSNLDDVIVAKLEVHHTTLDRSDVYADVLIGKTLVKIVNNTSGALLRTFLADSTSQDYIHEHREDRVPTGATTVQKANATIMAMDLRTLAFVVRQKYTEFPVVAGVYSRVNWNTGLSAMRIKTFMKNVLIEDKVLSPGLAQDAALIAAFDNTAALQKMPIAERGHVGLPAYRASLPPIYQPYLTSPYYDPMAVDNSLFDAGAVLYARRVSELVAMRGSCQFAVHPDGSWSVATEPVAYYEGSRVGGYTIGSFTMYPFDVAKMRSGRVDIVHLKNGAPPAPGEPDNEFVKTSHLALFNKANKSTLVDADYLPAWVVETLVTGVTGTYAVDSRSQVAFKVNVLSEPESDFDTQGTSGNATINMYRGSGDPNKKVSVLGGSALFI